MSFNHNTTPTDAKTKVVFSKMTSEFGVKEVDVHFDGKYVGHLYLELGDTPQVEWCASETLEFHAGCMPSGTLAECKREIKQSVRAGEGSVPSESY